MAKNTLDYTQPDLIMERRIGKQSQFVTAYCFLCFNIY
jgi:hypothetical protein